MVSRTYNCPITIGIAKYMYSSLANVIGIAGKVTPQWWLCGSADVLSLWLVCVGSEIHTPFKVFLVWVSTPPSVYMCVCTIIITRLGGMWRLEFTCSSNC